MIMKIMFFKRHLLLLTIIQSIPYSASFKVRTARAPRCPPGYTWIAATGSSCFKITELMGSRVGNQTVNAEPSFHKACAQEGTRLASIKTLAEKTALFEWAFGSEFTKDKYVIIIHV